MSVETKKTKETSWSFQFVLTIIFVIAKLAHLVHWSWWIVFLPLWGPFAFIGAIFVLIIAVMLIVSLFN